MSARNPIHLLFAAALGCTLVACGGADVGETAGPAEPMPAQSGDVAGDSAADVDGLTAAPPRSGPDEAASRPRTGQDDDPARPGGMRGDAAAVADTDADAGQAVIGEWTVSGHRMGSISALDDSGAQQLHGRELAFTQAIARSGEDQCVSPRYDSRRAGVLEYLLAEHRSNPVELGLQVAADAELTVVSIHCGAQPWSTLGAHVLILPDGQTLAPWDGVFFELAAR